jgi:uncharacterized SAM-binding protein YcdF (DUF218 family)
MTTAPSPFDTGLMTSLTGMVVRAEILAPGALENVVTLCYIYTSLREALVRLGVPGELVDRAGRAANQEEAAAEIRAAILAATPERTVRP